MNLNVSTDIIQKGVSTTIESGRYTSGSLFKMYEKCMPEILKAAELISGFTPDDSLQHIIKNGICYPVYLILLQNGMKPPDDIRDLSTFTGETTVILPNSWMLGLRIIDLLDKCSNKNCDGCKVHNVPDVFESAIASMLQTLSLVDVDEREITKSIATYVVALKALYSCLMELNPIDDNNDYDLSELNKMVKNDG